MPRLFPYSAILLGLTLSFSRPVLAQEITKPRTGTPTTDRLAKPASITAAQLPDGRIRVVWSAVSDAASYRLYRSVSPEGSKAVALPSPNDTVYIDADLTLGSTYAYQVDAVNGAGIEGLKAGSAPVTANQVDSPHNDLHFLHAWPKKY